MTKTTLALAAALLAGTTLTSAANAGGVRVGFGFPLGSFVAQPNQSYSEPSYGRDRHCDKPRYAARRRYLADAAPARKIKRAPKVEVAAKTSKPEVQTAKLEDKLVTNEETTTEIAKTPPSEVSGTQSTATTTSTTTAVLDKESGNSGTTTFAGPGEGRSPQGGQGSHRREDRDEREAGGEDGPGVCRQARVPPVLGCHRRLGRRSLPVRSTG